MKRKHNVCKTVVLSICDGYSVGTFSHGSRNIRSLTITIHRHPTMPYSASGIVPAIFKDYRKLEHNKCLQKKCLLLQIAINEFGIFISAA